MAYHREAGAFFNWLLTREMSRNGYLLCHVLFAKKIITGSTGAFRFTDSELQVQTKLSMKAIEKARKELINLDYIHYTTNGDKAGIYELHDFGAFYNMTLATE